MIIFVIIVCIIVIAVVIAGAIWFAYYRRRLAQGKNPAKATAKGEALPFRLNYIILPVAILLLSIILSAFFYRLLPADVAYHFQLNGTPDRWLSRGMAMAWVLMPQIFLALLAWVLVWVITKLRIFSMQTGSTWIKPEGILPVMGNMIALAQLVIFFAMLDIFSYNSYQVHIMPMWVSVLIILGIATIALVLLLVFIFSRAKKQFISQPKE